MTLQLALAHATKVALLVLLTGVVVRGKARQCWSFVGYVLVILVGNTLVSLRPEQFFNYSFYLAKQHAYDVLKMAVALELAWRAFAAFPGAWQRAKVVLASVLALSTATILAVQAPATYSNFFDWEPRVTTSAIWLLTATALVVVHYEIPIRDWQRAIMLGYAPYLLFFVTLLGMLKRHGWAVRTQVGTLDQVAYLVVAVFWAYSAWRPERRVSLPLAVGGAVEEALSEEPVEQTEQTEEAVDAHA